MTEIPASAIREIGKMADVDGRTVRAGVDCDAVTIQIAHSLTARLSAAERDQFMRLLFDAERAAEAWAKEHAGAGDG
jgi:hypothetical protein